jgi:branched-chain amino acid transport system substrate-binding protein
VPNAAVYPARTSSVALTDPIKIGVLFSESGVTGAIGRSQLQGTLLAVQEINAAGGIDGRELVTVQADPASNPARYARLAEHMIVRERVNTLFGCYMSSSRKAVIPVIEKWNKLLFYPTLYEGFEFSNNVIYTGAAPNQNSVQLAGSDYIYPYESNRIMTDLVLQHPHSATLGEAYVRLDADEHDFAPIIADIKARQPDFIFSTVVGDATARFYQMYAQAGLDPRRMPIASLTTSEAEIAQMGVAAALGHYTSAPYFQSIETPSNRQCLARYRQAFGAHSTPNSCWEAAYFQVHLYANAYRQAGDDALDLLLPHLLGSQFDAPQGRVAIAAANHHTCLYPRIGRVDAHGQFEIVQQAAHAVPPDPYLVDHALGEWRERQAQLEPQG